MGDKKIKTGFNKAKFYRRLVLVIYDIISIVAASYLAVLIRYEFHISNVPEHFLTPINDFLAINVIVTIIIFAAFRLYDSLWAFAGEMELQNLVVSCVISCIINAIGLQFFKIEKQPVPQSYYFLYTFLLISFILKKKICA